MYAELSINIEAALEGTFHYDVPADLRPFLRIGHMVEVEFGRRQAQGIILAFSDTAPVSNTKPIIALVDDLPVVWPWQIELARWMSAYYLTPLNACLRLMLPPGLTRWAHTTVDVNPFWEGQGHLSDAQSRLIDLLRQKGYLRDQEIQRALPDIDWKTVVNQLANRQILRKASVLDAPRIRPKEIRTAELIAGPERIWTAVSRLGRASKQAEVLIYLAELDDPLPPETAVLAATQATPTHLEALITANLITRSDFTFTPTPATTLSLAVAHRDVLGHVCRLRQAEVYLAILHLLAQAAQPVPLSEIYSQTKATLTHLRKLEKLDVIRFGAAEVWRDSLADKDFVPAEAPLLTADQARVWGRVKVDMLADAEAEGDAPVSRPVLLHGVTGSGKTEIYMRAIEFAMQRGQTAIVLVPEIALTPQTVRRFAARFPGRVAVLHSRLSDGERYDTWRRARLKLFDIIIGPRSALFTPLPNLGVIVVDEEHDPSYKQTPPVPPPYYHARETAVSLSKITGAKIILGSATPDIVTYHLAQSGHYQLLELPRRVMGHRQRISGQAQRLKIASYYRNEGDDPDEALTIPLPPIQLVDMRQELRAGNRSIFSRALETAVTTTLERQEQAILFLNRRGTATYVFCRDCGHLMKCPRCDMPLTYHRPQLRLVCHYCGRQEVAPSECPTCGSRRIKHFGLGTEEIEAQVQQHWPNARLTRWDRDTTAGRDSHEQLLSAFINQESDILVGTQMIAKGLDLPLVTLVGVISADVSLGLPDYHTAERAFQVLAQVAGRAGRGLRGGRVVVQTYQPEHYAIRAAAEHDFANFYLDEIRFRTQHMLPPFRRLAKLVWLDVVNEHGQQEAEKLAQGLRAHIRKLALSATDILGPTPPFFSRVDGRYRWQIIIRSPNPIRLLTDFPIPAGWQVDIDPVSTL